MQEGQLCMFAGKSTKTQIVNAFSASDNNDLKYNLINTNLETPSPYLTCRELSVRPRNVNSHQKAAESQRLKASRKQFVALK